MMRELIILTAICFVGAVTFMLLGRILVEVVPIVVRWFQ